MLNTTSWISQKLTRQLWERQLIMMHAFTKQRTKLSLCYLVAVILTICPGFAVSLDWTTHDCFTCRDKSRCPNIERIFGPHDSLLFEKELKENIPNCSGVRPVGKNCSVCHSDFTIKIYCPINIQKFEAETNGLKITNISKGCEEEQNTNRRFHGPTTGASQISAHTGVICVALLFILSG